MTRDAQSPSRTTHQGAATAMFAGEDGDDIEAHGQPPGLCGTFPAVAATVPEVRHLIVALAERAGACDAAVEGLRLAISEALTNVVIHAFPVAAVSPELHVHARVIGGELVVLLTDDGRGIGAASPDNGLGWGLRLIAAATKELVITERATGGTELQMRFALAG